MKNRLITLAGLLALLAVAGKFYAVPAMAQAVRAALVQDRDSRARNYYQAQNVNCGYLVGYCPTDLAVVPAGKRLVIDHVSGEVFTPGQNDLWRVALVAKNASFLAFFPFSSGSPTGNNFYNHLFSQDTFAVFEAGQTPQIAAFSSGAGAIAWQASVSGYMIDVP